MRPVTPSFSLLMGSDRHPVVCLSVEVSERWISVRTSENLTSSTPYVLNDGRKDFELRLVPPTAASGTAGLYRFQTKDPSQDVGQLLFMKADDARQRPNAPTLLDANLTINGCVVKSARFTVDTSHIAVAARTMGTRADYHMQPLNISKSGFLLAQQGGSPAPFKVNTLIEVGVAISHGETRANISCLGKVVRCVREQNQRGEDTTGFGVQIIEIDPSQMHVWESYVASIGAAA